MSPLAVAMCIILGTISALHVAWGAGASWPARDRLSLARMVVGARGIKNMPSNAACYGAAFAIAAAALWPLLMTAIGPLRPPHWLVTLGGATLAVVFLARGIVSYVPFFRNKFSEQPFARLDQVCYGPLCLALGIGYLALLL